jgi:hypothetical protein
MRLHTPLLIPLVLALAGCRSTPVPEPAPPDARARVDSLERLEIPIGGILLVKHDHNMASYDQLMVDSTIVTIARGSNKLSSAETLKLEAHLREAAARELVNVDLSKVVDEPGPCVLRMQTSFLDLELPPLTTGVGSHTVFVRTHGSVTLVHELRDSMTGTVLLRYMGRRHAPGGSAVSTVSRWSGLTRTFDEMLSDLKQSLVETVPLSTAIEGPLAHCHGRIYKKIEVGSGGPGSP